MILRLGLLVLLVLTLAGVASAQMPVAPVAIEVDGNTIALAPADADAFQRRLNQPPMLDAPPQSAAPSYTVTTAYWDPAVRDEDDEPAVAEAAEYFPDGGFVRARRGGEDVWLVLDLRQRAILDRYIRFGIEEGRPGPRPGALEVLLFASRSETIGIEAGSNRLDDEEARIFWDAIVSVAAAPTFLDPQRPPGTISATGYWLTFTLPEGRSLQYFVDTTARTFTDSLGTESYDASGLIGGALPESVPALQIAQEETAGSLLWWLLAVGGGAALLALAFMLQGRAVRSG